MWAIYNNENSVTLLSDHNGQDGCYEYIEQPVNSKYYKVGPFKYRIEGDTVIGTQAHALKSLEELQKEFIRDIKNKADSMLSKTDWMVIRQFEGGPLIPEEISNYRSSVRASSNEKEQAVLSCVTFDELVKLDNKKYIETHLVRKFVSDDVPVEYGPETEQREVTLSIIEDLWPDDPTTEQSKTFVERIEVTDGN
jgi:hypothetical protein